MKLLTSNFNTFYSPQNKGLLTITPKDTLILDTETHKNNRIQKTVQIDKEKNKILLFNVYGPPSSQKKHKVQFLTDLDKFIQDTGEQHPLADVVVTGDFNIQRDKNNYISRKLTDIMDKHSLIDAYRFKNPDKKANPGFTRFPYKGQNGTPTRLDMIFINKKHTNIHLKLSTGNSDHKMIYLETNKAINAIRKESKKSFAGALFDSPTHLSNLNNLINT